MKMDMQPKSENGESAPGEYTQDQLDEMLENYVEAKKIESDPKLLAVLKDYAQSKHKMVAELFDVNRTPAPKSLKDLKKTYNDKVASEDDSE